MLTFDASSRYMGSLDSMMNRVVLSLLKLMEGSSTFKPYSRPAVSLATAA